ncbi:chloride channel protein [Nocardia terpenica]|uniref:chloride channel protein n=1 Tax=Nocardia terpenica TaxID=455432 RepID=UPI001895C051|nr:chloride channel protein [Nocardia terpenica]MBF6066139.1 chloride channel protein [Nocardia terpenica]MBF6109171.1 chloride channel protein [Nocardia terpenica]MBF6116383.1 chloride channel protein [Nocardia terpenica]MBF6123540.1 chloride channel protein [Nocardia terpenica]MBF6156817.1 chloride channel protein [Nocardia terpenica]
MAATTRTLVPTGRRWSLQVPARIPAGEWVRESRGGLVALALVIGAGAGGGAVVFRWLITTFTRLLSGYTDYSATGRVPNPHLPALGPWFVVAAPVVAGLIYGPLVSRFAPEARGHGVPEVMYAVAARGGRIPPQVTVVKALASALCIGGGGSVGREGPIVQIGSAWGSSLGRFTRVPDNRLRILVACGAAGGIAATFNTPIAGPFFAMELILRDFAAESFGAVVLSSVTASVIGRAVFGNHPFLDLPVFSLRSGWEYLIFVVLGIVIGIAGVVFTHVLYWIEDACDWIWRGPEWLRPAVGGVVLGGLLLVLPQMYGVGYPVLAHAIGGGYVLWMLLALMAGKMLATGLTIGIGGSGGVFAPSLFIGAMGGTAFGIVVHQMFPAATAAPGMYGVVGMGAAFAGATRAALTAIIVLFELTGEYTIILPLMLAIVAATAVSRVLSKDTIYTRKLTRRGVDLDAAHHNPNTRWNGVTVGSVMELMPEPIAADTPVEAASRAVWLSANGILPVTGPDQRYHGCVTARAVAEATADPESTDRTVADLTVRPPEVVETFTLLEALDILAGAEGAGVPVLDSQGHAVVGWLTHRAVLAALQNPAPTAAA